MCQPLNPGRGLEDEPLRAMGGRPSGQGACLHAPTPLSKQASKREREACPRPLPQAKLALAPGNLHSLMPGRRSKKRERERERRERDGCEQASKMDVRERERERGVGRRLSPL